MLALGRRLAAAAPQAAVRSAAWQPLTIGAAGLPEADLITMCYLLGELPAADREPVLTELAARGQTVALIEPGTPAGYRRVLAARQLLIEAGLRIVAPCPHDLGCPVAGGRDWCHFAARTGRTALHRRLKSGALGYEDEKFSYLVAARTSWPRAGGRVLRHPRLAKGAVTLTRCAAEPGVATETVFKRDRELYRRARNTAWGDPWPPAGSGQDASPGPDAPG
jgi:ribosomal protein RSM22 (predicted rRNA methylase)